jgi:hypothetical protein
MRSVDYRLQDCSKAEGRKLNAKGLRQATFSSGEACRDFAKTVSGWQAKFAAAPRLSTVHWDG